MATYKETTRSGRKICTMRYFGRIAVDICLSESTWEAGNNPIMANKVDHAPCR